MLKVSVLVWPTWIQLGEKALLMLGGRMLLTVRVAEAELPVPPLLLVTVLLVFVYVPAIAGVIPMVIWQEAPDESVPFDSVIVPEL